MLKLYGLFNQFQPDVVFLVFFLYKRFLIHLIHNQLCESIIYHKYSIILTRKRMCDKQNEIQTKKHKIGTSSRRTKNIQASNDYVFKRYRLEQNRHFAKHLLGLEDKNIEFKHQSPLNYQDHQQSQDNDQDLIIVPLDLPIQLSSHQEQSPQAQEKKVNSNDMVYIFDDDQYIQQGCKEQQIQNNEDKYNMSFKSEFPNINDISSKGSERGNVSTAEFMNPKHKKDTFLFESSHFPTQMNNQQRKIFQRKSTINFRKREIQTSELQQIQGVQIQEDKKQKTISISIIDKKVFSISRLPSGIILKCIIKRTSSFFNMLSPEYDLYIANGLKHIVSAKKYPMKNRQLFKFSTDPVKFTDSSLLAVMHANTNHNVYWLLDLPKKLNGTDISIIHLLIAYYRIKKDSHRKFSVLLPEMKGQYRLAMNYQQSFINYSNFKEESHLELNNLQQQKGQSKNSTKNFVIADQDDPDYRYLQMEKQSDNIFELVIQHPLSPLQAMAIAMTRFDVQLS